MIESSLPKISGFLMTEPICLRAWAPAFCTFMWESVSTSHKRGTILGRHDDNCFGAQNAIAPSSSTLPKNKQNKIMLNKMQSEQQVPHHFQKLSNLRSFVMDNKHLGRISTEYRKTKTQVITLANKTGQRQPSKPITTQSKYMKLTRCAGKCAPATHDWFWFHF